MNNDRFFDGAWFLEFVTEKLKRCLEAVEDSLRKGKEEITSMHEYYWENYAEMDQYGYEDYDNQQALLNQVNANQDRLVLKHRFERMADSPFFGRVDFEKAIAMMSDKDIQTRLSSIIQEDEAVCTIKDIHRVFETDLTTPFKTVFKWNI